MSASTEKKQRQAAREAGTDRKAKAAQEAAEKQAVSRRRTVIVCAVLAVAILLAVVFASGVLYTGTTAVSAGSGKFSPAEMNYYYLSQYQDWTNNYGSYASIFGLDTSVGPYELKDQDCPLLEDGSWRDYFLREACDQVAQIQGAVEYAGQNGITLSEEELSEIDTQLSQMELIAQVYGYSNASHYLSANYGTGMNTRLLREILCDSALANAAQSQFMDTLQYSDEELEDNYASFEGSYDYFDYAYYYVQAENAVEDGEDTGAPNEMTLLEARMTAEAIQTSYLDDPDTEDISERLNAAVEAEFDDAEATVREHTAATSLGDLSDWLMAEHEPGDVGVVEDAAGAGYFVVAFIGRDDNHYNTVSVRHILINAEAGEDGTWSDEALEAAREEAARILAEWKAGEATEESFAALAEQYSDDTGSNTNGGLYENIAKHQMVDEFDAFCFGGHQPGDTDIVYGSNGSYAGYHVIYFVGEGEQYSNLLSRTALQNAAVEAWLAEITPEYKMGPFAWLAAK